MYGQNTATGTFAISWGPSGGFYVRWGYVKRVCLGRVALTYCPDVEVDSLMEAYVEKWAA